MFGEMDTAAKLHKFATGDPTSLPAETVFRMATTGGARVLNQQDHIGSLEVGKKADIVLVETRRAGNDARSTGRTRTSCTSPGEVTSARCW